MASHEIQPAKGQVWADSDPNGKGRHLRILQVVPGRGDKPAYVIAVQCNEAGQVIGRPPRTKIPLARFTAADPPFRLAAEA